jgi:hypothetical protein
LARFLFSEIGNPVSAIAVSISVGDLWNYIWIDWFGWRMWDFFFWFSIVLSLVCIALFRSLAWTKKWRVRRTLVLCIFVTLCVGFPMLMRSKERSSYEFAKEQVEWAEEELEGGDKYGGDWLKNYYDQTLAMIERYEAQFPEKVIK